MTKRSERSPPLCVMPACNETKKRQRFADFPCDQAAVEKMKETLKSRPSDGSRSKQTTTKFGNKPAALKVSDFSPDTSTRVTMETMDRNSFLNVRGQSDDGSDDSLASPHVDNEAVLDGIGSFRKSNPVSFQVTLLKDAAPQEFTLSNIWTLPLTVLNLE